MIGRSARATTGNGRHRSFWLQEALAQESGDLSAPLYGTIRADLCIVGGGFTGLWTAIQVKDRDPSISVVIVEADICGGGASGRNGGMVLSWWPKIETLLERTDADEARRLAQASEDAIAAIGAFCEREQIDAHFCQKGWLWTATSPAQVDAWAGAVRACERLGVSPFIPLSADEVRRRTGSPVHLGGVLEPSGATVQPALLARGLRRVALARGVQIFEQTPMIRLDRRAGIVHTPAGAVEASTIVLATNAWAAQVRELRRAMVPLGSDMVVTEPMPDALAESGWTGGESISNSRLMVHYYRTTRDGRVAFGRGGGQLAALGRIGAHFDLDPRLAGQVADDLQRLVPAARGVRIAHAWGGPVDRSHDGLPLFGRLPGRVPIWYGVGFSGNGVGPSYLAGKILAASVLEQADEWATCSLARGVQGQFPPEPIRFFGGILVREAVRRKEGREDLGLRVDPLTRRLAALAPSGYFKVTPTEHRQEPTSARTASSAGGRP